MSEKNNGSPTPLLLTAKQVQSMLGIGKTSLYRLVSSGKLESIQLGRARRFKYAAVAALAERGTSIERQGDKLGLRIAS